MQLQNQPILIVEDDLDIGESLKDALSMGGYTAIVAESGADALEHLRNGVTPSLILIDLMMPGMNGMELCQKIKESAVYKSFPVILVSASRDIALKAVATGADSWLTKPIDLAPLLELAEKYSPSATKH